MNLNVANLVPASLKAKEVATQEYVDTEIAAIPQPDVSAEIANSNDLFAQSLGFTNYAALQASSANTRITTINGGNIQSSLIDVDVALADAILSQDITYTGTITGGSNGTGGKIRSYDGSMEIDLVNGFIYIS